ncbi:hypothetical protein [Kitasatospora griseola]|uniref:hypothetical protein n=1 Tax=Kitasatospora griseola TaxID=2064 RepID=UPI00380644F7
MPAIDADHGRDMPHHDHITQVVTALEAAGRGPGDWTVDHEGLGGAAHAVLGRGTGAHDPQGDPDAYDADLLLTAHREFSSLSLGSWLTFADDLDRLTSEFDRPLTPRPEVPNPARATRPTAAPRTPGPR